MRSRRSLLVLATAVAFLAPAAASAQTAQTRIVVPFTAGGVVDSIARIVAEKMTAKSGQQVIVDNRAGAGGSVGTEFVARSTPDGTTLLLVSPGHAVAPSLNKKLGWDPVRDFRAIAGFGVIPNAIVVHPGVAAQTLPEFIALAKKSPSPLTYATAGIGTSNHLSGELLAQSAGIKLTHVPYKGQPDALNDLLGGRVDMMPLTVALAAPHIKTGKLRALAVTTATRSTALPSVPTAAEAAGLPGYEVGTWFGLVAPAKTPDETVRKLAAELAEILAQPDVKQRLEQLGMELAPQTPAQFDAFVGREQQKWARVIKQAGIEAQ
jgi:tripartite-type tricarboxylate transporter receptor subunit TctC